jgi:integrase
MEAKSPEALASLDMKKGFKEACRRAEIKGLRFHDLRHYAELGIRDTHSQPV